MGKSTIQGKQACAMPRESMGVIGDKIVEINCALLATQAHVNSINAKISRLYGESVQATPIQPIDNPVSILDHLQIFQSMIADIESTTEQMNKELTEILGSNTTVY